MDNQHSCYYMQLDVGLAVNALFSHFITHKTFSIITFINFMPDNLIITASTPENLPNIIFDRI